MFVSPEIHILKPIQSVMIFGGGPLGKGLDHDKVMNGINILIKDPGEIPSLLLYEDTVKRQWSMNQEAGSHQVPVLVP